MPPEPGGHPVSWAWVSPTLAMTCLLCVCSASLPPHPLLPLLSEGARQLMYLKRRQQGAPHQAGVLQMRLITHTHTHTRTHTHTTKALPCQALSGRSCGRRRDRLQVVVSEAPGILTLTDGHTPHLKASLWGFVGWSSGGPGGHCGHQLLRGPGWAAGRNVGVPRGALEARSPSRLLLRGLAGVRRALALAVLTLASCG